MTQHTRPAPSRAKWDQALAGGADARPGDVLVEVYSPVQPPPTLPETLDDARVPPQPPVIVHVAVPAGLTDDARLSAVGLVVAHAGLRERYVAELADFGALYVRVGVPDARTSPRARRVVGEAAHALLPAGEAIYARVYANPKRHFARGEVQVLGRVGEVVAVQKPAGIPVAAGCDNLRECVLGVLEQQGVRVGICARLDVGTSGVLLCAESREAARGVNEMMRSSGCVKVYKVLTRRKPKVGCVRHLYNKKARLGRGIVQTRLLKEEDEGDEDSDGEADACRWVLAELHVLHSQRLMAHGGVFWESEVRLVTGRTHQIRLQFAAMGCAVVGDCKYAPVNGRVLHAGQKDAAPDEVLRLGEDTVCHGLHAHSVAGVLGGEEVRFEAASPWWWGEGAGELDEGLGGMTLCEDGRDIDGDGLREG